MPLPSSLSPSSTPLHSIHGLAFVVINLTLTRTLTRTLTLTLTLTLSLTLNYTLLQEEADLLRSNVQQAELQLKAMVEEDKQFERCADVAKKECEEKVANADLQAKSHERRSDIKRRYYERHRHILQVSLSLRYYLL